jgi:hypothetical protein
LVWGLPTEIVPHGFHERLKTNRKFEREARFLPEPKRINVIRDAIHRLEVELHKQPVSEPHDVSSDKWRLWVSQYAAGGYVVPSFAGRRIFCVNRLPSRDEGHNPHHVSHAHVSPEHPPNAKAHTRKEVP